jgi:hypothetical protein
MCSITIYSKKNLITTWKLKHTHWMVTMLSWIKIKHNLNENNFIFLQFVGWHNERKWKQWKGHSLYLVTKVFNVNDLKITQKFAFGYLVWAFSIFKSGKGEGFTSDGSQEVDNPTIVIWIKILTAFLLFFKNG